MLVFSLIPLVFYLMSVISNGSQYPLGSLKVFNPLGSWDAGFIFQWRSFRWPNNMLASNYYNYCGGVISRQRKQTPFGSLLSIVEEARVQRYGSLVGQKWPSQATWVSIAVIKPCKMCQTNIEIKLENYFWCIGIYAAVRLTMWLPQHVLPWDH